MKKLTSMLLCMVLVLSMFCVNAAAAENTGIEARAAVANAGTVTVVVSTKQTAANSRLEVAFDSDCLTYAGCETDFAVHTVKAEEGKLTIGLANATADAVSAGGVLAELRFTVIGKWKQTAIDITTGGEKLTVLTNASRFEDVSAGKWYYEAVETMAAEGYIKGITATLFGPDLEMNRGSFVTLLGRLEGIEETHVKTRFTDVKATSFCSGYVAWADEQRIVKGISDTLFAPKSPVTREQMVTFLYRYAVSKGIDVTVADPEAVLDQFPDADSVSAFAVKAMTWAVDRGIIKGMDGKLAPRDTSTRAQAVVMLYRFFYEQ